MHRSQVGQSTCFSRQASRLPRCAALQCLSECWLSGNHFLISLLFSSIYQQQLPVSNFIKFFSSTIHAVAHFLLTSSECLLKEGIKASKNKDSEVFSPMEIAACKEECAQSAVSQGAPFWTFNSENGKCHFRTVYKPEPEGRFWAGNTDPSCDYSCGCASGCASDSTASESTSFSF